MQDDFDNLTDEQFAEMGKQHEAAQVEAAKQARDEQGRFVAVETEPEPVVNTEETDEPDEIVYRRVIDLGDGSGTQVFEGETPEDLIEKLATAQEHATRKIRELTAAKKPVEPTEPVVSADEDWLISQELMATPSKGFQKLFEQQVGMPVSAFKSKMARVEAFETAQTAEINAKSFVEAHPEYVGNPHNGGLMQSYLKTYRLEATPENIEQAFTTLSQGGLLQLKADEPVLPGNTEPKPNEQRIAAPAGVRTVVIQKKAASGLSAKGSAVTKGPPSTQDLYEMPMDEFLKVGGMTAQDNW